MRENNRMREIKNIEKIYIFLFFKEKNIAYIWLNLQRERVSEVNFQKNENFNEKNFILRFTFIFI